MQPFGLPVVAADGAAVAAGTHVAGAGDVVADPHRNGSMQSRSLLAADGDANDGADDDAQDADAGHSAWPLHAGDSLCSRRCEARAGRSAWWAVDSRAERCPSCRPDGKRRSPCSWLDGADAVPFC